MASMVGASSSSPIPPTPTDWQKCIVCQTVTDEALQCPKASKRANCSGYTTIANNLHGFEQIGCLSPSLDLARLDDGTGVQETLQAHSAQWHTSCRLKYSAGRLSRAVKTKVTDDGEKEGAASSPKKLRQRLPVVSPASLLCFLCSKPEGTQPLRQVTTFEIHERVKDCAEELGDKELQLLFSAGGDLMSQEAKYHPKCLVALYNRRRPVQLEAQFEAENHALALADLVEYIQSTKEDHAVAPVFKLSDLADLYSQRLQQLGTVTLGRPHTGRLKDRLITHLPNLDAYKQGHDTLLAFKTDVGPALKNACDDTDTHDEDSEAILLAKAARLLHKAMGGKLATFEGKFDADCQERSVPPKVLEFVGMLLNGRNIRDQSTVGMSKTPAQLSIAQLLVYNRCSERSKSPCAVRHSHQSETPLPIYLGMMVHTRTRKRKLVEALHNLGLSISYERVLSISSDVGNKICQLYESEDAVCPPGLLSGVFTTAAVDNIDHNPSSTTARDSFHGTGISLFQHACPGSPGSARPVDHGVENTSAGTRSIAKLPESYTVVPPLAFEKRAEVVPKLSGPNSVNYQLIEPALKDEQLWLEKVHEKVSSWNPEEPQDHTCLSWGAFHADKAIADDRSTAITSLLPLFHDAAHSEAMIRHSMDMVKVAVNILNPTQIPVVTLDQPLYALAKRIQWTWPNTHGEDQFVIILGGLHIEMAALKFLGDLLDGSEWVSVLVQAGVATSGKADSFLKVSHVKRTRYAHQVTVGGLHCLLQRAYHSYQHSEDVVQPFDDWCAQRQDNHQFHFWFLIMQLELLVLTFIRSVREANFLLYVDALAKMAPWFFALDHTNYARWIAVHIRDMAALEDQHLGVHTAFMNGHFTVKKTTRSFSTMAIDQAHEQNNATVKADGGAVGLTENPKALRRWMISGPAMAQLITEFESSMENDAPPEMTNHHEASKHTQVKFMTDVKSLVDVIEELGNPFSDTSGHLMKLCSRDIVDEAVADTIKTIQQLGQNQYDEFVRDRLVGQEKVIQDPIKKNSLPLFKRPHVRVKSKGQQQVSSLKNDRSLFSRLYIASQIRSGDLDNFFSHENQASPPSLSQGGKLKLGKKSDLVECLSELTSPHDHARGGPSIDALIIDGAVVVNMLRPQGARTFAEYSSQVFLPYLTSQLQRAKRLDLVWDSYLPNSLKSTTRATRGKGTRRLVQPSTKIPVNWQEFLRVDENKEELFSLLSTEAVRLETQLQIVSTHKKGVLSRQPRDSSYLEPCTHEEADTRMFLHLTDLVREGHTRVQIRTVDTDVVVLAVTAVSTLDIAELWVAFGTGKSFRYLPAHEMAAKLGPEKCKALPIFHAFTGCDTVSSFHGRGKKTCWNAWKVFGEVTEAFCTLNESPDSVHECLEVVERFVILIYDRTSNAQSVNEARKVLFSQNGREIEHIPPTKEALRQHLQRALYQAVFCWGQMFSKEPQLPSPSDWGWQQSDGGPWEPKWTTLPEATTVCRELLRCGCKKGCSNRCSCVKAALQCTALCHCGGQCNSSQQLA